HGITRMMEGEPIIAPLSGLRCVWYRFTVEEKTEGKGEWRLVRGMQCGRLPGSRAFTSWDHLR
ncbi:MAG: hypothetical protein ACKOJF_33630, partial [Planctomycetaceae bacterium]